MNLSLVLANVFAVPSPVLAQASDDSVNPILSWLPFILIGAALYFLAIRPQKKRARTLRQFQDSLSVGDEVRTAGGIIGVVSSISEREVMVDVGGITLKLTRGAIAAYVGGETE